MTEKTFLYFAYGSNLSSERIRLNNPSAVAKAPAILEGYQLNFNKGSIIWRGCVATIEENSKCEVYGVLWELDRTHLTTLDYQEGVARNNYRRFEVKVRICDQNGEPHSSPITAYTYQLLKDRYLPEGSDCRPSAVYKQVIVKGAREHRLPGHYIKKLENIKDNGYNGKVGVKVSLCLQQAVGFCSII